VTDDELRTHLSDRLVRYKIPRTFEFVADPLRDDAGKVRRSALRAERLG
jgi:bile acid-coenzyme A ligase